MPRWLRNLRNAARRRWYSRASNWEDLGHGFMRNRSDDSVWCGGYLLGGDTYIWEEGAHMCNDPHYADGAVRCGGRCGGPALIGNNAYLVQDEETQL